MSFPTPSAIFPALQYQLSILQFDLILRLPGVSTRHHRLKAQAHKTAPPQLQRLMKSTRSPGYPSFCPAGLQLGVPTASVQDSVIFLKLEDNYLTVWCWFLPCISVNQPWVYLCPLSLEPPPPSFPITPLWVVTIPLLGIDSEETRIGKITCTPKFIAALFTIARTWRQPVCPSIKEWTRKLWYIDTVEHYSTIKRSTFNSLLMRWMNPEPIIQSEISQKEKDRCCILAHTYGI